MRHIEEVRRLLEKQRKLADKGLLEVEILKEPINKKSLEEFLIIHNLLMRERRDIDWKIKNHLGEIAKTIVFDKNNV